MIQNKDGDDRRTKAAVGVVLNLMEYRRIEYVNGKGHGVAMGNEAGLHGTGLDSVRWLGRRERWKNWELIV